jgi:GH18 family chitinase
MQHLIISYSLVLNLRELLPEYGSETSVRINFVYLGALRRFNELKQISPSTKTLVAIGGWNAGSSTFSQVSSLF